MAVRVYRNLSAPAQATPPSAAQPAQNRRARAPAAGHPHADDVFDDAQPDSHIVERKARKENRAGRRELEAARRQLREMREDAAYDPEEV
jgi:hypothetical protein